MIFSFFTELVADFLKTGKMPKIRKEREMNVEFSSSKAAGSSFQGACCNPANTAKPWPRRKGRGWAPGTASSSTTASRLCRHPDFQKAQLLQALEGDNWGTGMTGCPALCLPGVAISRLPYGNVAYLTFRLRQARTGFDWISIQLPNPTPIAGAGCRTARSSLPPKRRPKPPSAREAAKAWSVLPSTGFAAAGRTLAGEFQNRHNNGWHQLLRRVPDTPDLRRTRPETETIENQKYLVFEGIVGRGFSSHYTRLEVLVPEKGPTLFRAERFQLLIDKWAKGEKSEILTSLEEVVEFAYRLRPDQFGPVQEGARRFLHAFSATAEKQADWRRRPKNSARDFIKRAERGGLKANIGEILAEKQANGH